MVLVGIGTELSYLVLGEALKQQGEAGKIGKNILISPFEMS